MLSDKELRMVVGVMFEMIKRSRELGVVVTAKAPVGRRVKRVGRPRKRGPGRPRKDEVRGEFR